MRRPVNGTLIISDQSAAHNYLLQLVQQFKSLASGLVNVGEYSRRRIPGEYSPMIIVDYEQSLFSSNIPGEERKTGLRHRRSNDTL